LGQEFAWSLLTVVAGQPDEALQRLLAHLQAEEFIYEQPAFPESAYIFKHALTQEVAYNAVLLERRRVVHERAAQAIARLCAERLPEPYNALAHQYSRSGNPAKAIDYLPRAGQQAGERSAYAEAVSHLTSALDLLTTLPETRERSQQELAGQMTRGMVLAATKGCAAPEVAHAYTRAHALCREVGDTPQLISVLSGLSGFHGVRAEFKTGKELAEQYPPRAPTLQAPTRLGMAHRWLGQTTFWRGELVAAHAPLQQSITLYNPEQRRAQALHRGQDPGGTGRSWLALTLGLLGYPAQAPQRSHEALPLAQELAHPFTLVVALTLSAWLQHFLSERHAAQEQAAPPYRLAL